jgi:hypothetical protein
VFQSDSDWSLFFLGQTLKAVNVTVMLVGLKMVCGLLLWKPTQALEARSPYLEALLIASLSKMHFRTVKL